MNSVELSQCSKEVKNKKNKFRSKKISWLVQCQISRRNNAKKSFRENSDNFTKIIAAEFGFSREQRIMCVFCLRACLWIYNK